MQSNKTSLWVQTGQYPSFPTLDADLNAEVVIVGGGITGLTTAYLLLKKGIPVIVLEAEKIGHGTTGFSTGHLTAGIDADYSFLQSRFGPETARQVAQSMMEAINCVERICLDENLDADFARIPAYQFTEDPKQVKELEDEIKAAQEAGLSCEAIDAVPLPFSVVKAFRLDNQADFHPLKFVQGLSQCIRYMGGLIFENTRVTDVDDSEPCVVSTHNGPKVRARQVILATHTPVQFNMVQTELLPYQSYVVVAQLNGQEIAKGLYWDTLEFYHYIRTYEADGKKYLVVGGEDHKTGDRERDINEHFERLEDYIRTHFGNLPITHRWSAEFSIRLMDCLSLAGVPLEKINSLLRVLPAMGWYLVSLRPCCLLICLPGWIIHWLKYTIRPGSIWLLPPLIWLSKTLTLRTVSSKIAW